MHFEDAKLPDTPLLRFAFNKAAFSVSMDNMFGDAPAEDKGIGRGSMKLLTRVAEILKETVPGATDEIVGTAMLFLTPGFQEPELMRRGMGAEMPRGAELAQEWRNVQTRSLLLRDASLELRQIVTAVDTAMLEGSNAALKRPADRREMQLDLYETLYAVDDTAVQVGDIKAPALVAKFKAVREETNQLLRDPPPAAPSAPRP